jgi:hypothetical protein
MKIQLNEVVRAAQAGTYPDDVPRDKDGFVNFYCLLSDAGRMKSGNVQRPMFHHKPITRDGIPCYPAMYFHSNPYKTDRKVKPWTDILLPDEGYVYYNGDNQTPGLMPSGKKNSGNSTMEKLWPLYLSKEEKDRNLACPIVIFEQTNEVLGKIKGYRKFRGYGIVTKVEIRQEYEPKTERVFSNYLFEITLFEVPPDGLDWKWIYDRRDKQVDLKNLNKRAPKAWKDWVRNGFSAIERNRQKILHYEVATTNQQREELGKTHKTILDQVVNHYPKSVDKGRFEGLASLVASEYFGSSNYERGWVTKHSGDMGVDFVGGLKIANDHAPNPPGTILGNSKLVVIGQAKCRTSYESKNAEEDAKDIARVASRLHRGYLGVYVTTGVYKVSTQREVSIDKYPIILINGRQLADLLNLYSSRTGKTIQTILNECDEWYENNRRDWPPTHILRELTGKDVSANHDR